jgi:hypothetical protein
VGAALVGLAVAGCSIFSSPPDSPLGPINEAGRIITSPSGSATAEFLPGEIQNGVPTLVPVVRSGGTVVFRSPLQYSTRHGVAMLWQESEDVLWILSSDVGTSRVEQQGATWSRTSMKAPQRVLDRAAR